MNAIGSILLVDDAPEFISVVSQMLTAEGYAVTEARSGEEALDRYAQLRPDLVLLDVVMTGIDGFETCRRLKQTYGDGCAPVIFFTAKSVSDDIAKGFAAGGADYLSKDCTTAEVRARIRAHLQNQVFLKEQNLLVEQLRRATVAKNRFIGMAAHDMRNPLVSIRGFAEFLLDGTVGPLTTQQLAPLNIIRSTSQSLLDLVNELLDVATIESGELKLNLAPQNLTELVAKSVALTRISAAKKRTSLEFSSAGDGPTIVMDADKMRQVVDNLLTNAIKYSPPGSTVVALVHSDPAAGTCSFAVRDQGPGIPEGDRHKLFKDFGSLSAQPTGGEKSTGLGLTICRKIVEAHRGTIIAENLPTAGCEFRVTLPATLTE